MDKLIDLLLYVAAITAGAGMGYILFGALIYIIWRI